MKPLKIWAYLDNFFFLVSKVGPKEKCWKTPRVTLSASISENPVPLCQIFSLVKKILWNYLTFIYHKIQHKALIISFKEFWNHWIKFKWIKCFWQKGQWAWVLHSKKVAKNDKKEPLYMFKMHCLYYIAINATNNCWFFLSFFLKLTLKKTYINLVIKSLDILRKAKKNLPHFIGHYLKSIHF